MILEIEKANFSIIRKLLDETMDNIEVKAIIEGINPGWVFVDSQKSPRTAMVWAKGIQGFYFVGDTNNPDFNNCINDFIDNQIKPKAAQQGLNRFEFSGETKNWSSVLEEIFINRKLEKSQQYIYKLKKDSWQDYQKRKLGDGFELRKINQEIFYDKQIKNINFLSLEIQRWWNSTEEYLNKAFGYCIIYDNKIVSYCICNFLHGDIYTIGIETLEEFRRNGLSQVATEAFVENCLDNQLIPHWECMESNLPSRALAEKLRFNRDSIYTLYSFPLTMPV